MSNEYSNSTVSGNGCSYSNLNTYNKAQNNSVNPPLPTGTTIGQGKYIVPVFATSGYNSLAGVGTCGGYPSITNAYGAGASSCSPSYVAKTCM